ncbi:TetR/AcrR family transcriptional regulator [Cucumibacter marinus]|uniref:TetR/AcrR family transcriptional regulator n=1 Tax=Cucumibacter marinus TaxID=1121252 RepID=UPI000491BB82|nr:TetR/AcrR family transcriptional regulator [Cucumibacter marinus]
MAATLDKIDSHKLTKRQREVLDAALGLLVEQGDRLTMTGVARRAHCSKETLYKWFGDRSGLLVATVQWQAAKVKAEPVPGDVIDRETLKSYIGEFTHSLLTVLAGDVSVALNRLAISHAASGADDLGEVVLANGRHALGRRLKPVLEAGKRAGLLRFADAEMTYQTLFGLTVRDIQIRLLLGDRLDLSPKSLSEQAARAAEQFFALYGREKSGL